ncbi:hypothetical protein F511_42754 [Dorcoceras hygrometricum]|uniref:Uncharacterized protein n=1 Tax=Dorcoceras hygrometricum TaxID=472368 RepID=A0A2Z7AFD5_9LAMI|nr:hypothetical protein F511_42754 [Dorcoceras hygrometricum]
MPPRRRGRATRQTPAESEGQNEEIQRSAPVRRCARLIDDEADVLAARVDEMELIMVTFQPMNPQTFDGDESSSDANHLSSSPSSQRNSMGATGLGLVVISSRRSRVLVILAPVVLAVAVYLGPSFVVSVESNTPRRSVLEFTVLAITVGIMDILRECVHWLDLITPAPPQGRSGGSSRANFGAKLLTARYCSKVNGGQPYCSSLLVDFESAEMTATSRWVEEPAAGVSLMQLLVLVFDYLQFTVTFDRRFPSHPAFIFDDFGGAGLLEFRSCN